MFFSLFLTIVNEERERENNNANEETTAQTSGQTRFAQQVCVYYFFFDVWLKVKVKQAKNFRLAVSQRCVS